MISFSHTVDAKPFSLDPLSLPERYDHNGTLPDLPPLPSQIAMTTGKAQPPSVIHDAIFCKLSLEYLHSQVNVAGIPTAIEFYPWAVTSFLDFQIFKFEHL